METEREDGSLLTRRRLLTLSKALTVSLVLFAGGLALAVAYVDSEPVGRRISLAEFDDLARDGRIDDLAILEEDAVATGSYSTPRGPTEYWMPYPSSDVVVGMLTHMGRASNAEVSIDDQRSKFHVRTLATFTLPVLIALNLFALFVSLIAWLVARRSSAGSVGPQPSPP